MASSLDTLHLGIYSKKVNLAEVKRDMPETGFCGNTKTGNNLFVIPKSLTVMVFYTIRLDFKNYKDLEMMKKCKQKVYVQCNKYAKNMCRWARA